MENSESYLNLNSDQFNSWLSEFETQFNKLEKKNLTSSHSQESCDEIDNDSICNSVEIECSSEDEDCDSNIFIKDNSSDKKICNSNSTISSNKCLFRYGRPLISSERYSESKKKSKKCSKKTKKRNNKSSTEEFKKKISESDCHVKSENKPNVCETKSSILTIQQINSIIPDLEHKRSKKVSKKKNNHLKIKEESNCHENIIVKKNIKLGSQALYRFIAKRSR